MPASGRFGCDSKAADKDDRKRVARLDDYPGGMLPMSHYRLYFMDRFSGHIDHVREFEAVDNADAIEIANDWHRGGPMELWSRHHKLKRWDKASLAQPRIPA